MTQADTPSPPQDPDLGHLAQDLSFVTRILRAQIAPRAGAVLQSHHIASGEIALLNLIQLNPGISQKDLAGVTVLKKSALTKLVNDLEASGLIERRKEGTDKRVNALYLTPGGTRRLAAISPDLAALQQVLLSGLSAGERVILFELLWRLIDSHGGPASAKE